jgi:hypothetical protein
VGPRNLVTGDCCGDAVGFATLRKAAMQGRRQAARAGVTPRIARSTSKAMRRSQRDHANRAASASAFVLALCTTIGRTGINHLIHVSGIDSNPRSRSLYIRKRGEGELAVRAAFPNAIVVRPAVMFGPDDAFLTTILSLLRRFPMEFRLNRSRKHFKSFCPCTERQSRRLELRRSRRMSCWRTFAAESVAQA